MASKKVSTPLLDSIIGRADNESEKVKLVVSDLTKDGEQFKIEEESATFQKAKKFAKVATLKDELEKRGLSEPVMKELRGQIGNSKGDGPLRAHEGQDLAFLTFRACFGLSKATAWRYARLIEYLQYIQAKPEKYGDAIKSEGGIEECLQKAKKYENVQAKLNDPATDQFGEPLEEESSDETHEEDGKIGAVAESGFKIAVSSDVCDAFEKKKAGDYPFVGFCRIGDGSGEVVMVTRDTDICEALVKAAENGELSDCHGIEVSDLNIRRKKPPAKKERVGYRTFSDI